MQTMGGEVTHLSPLTEYCWLRTRRFVLNTHDETNFRWGVRRPYSEIQAKHLQVHFSQTLLNISVFRV
jgi:hypothetical protein